MSRALLLSLTLMISACSTGLAQPSGMPDPALASLDAARVRAERQADAASVEVDALRAELDALTNAASDGDGQVAAVQAQLTRANARVAALQAELATAGASAGDATAQLAARDAQIAALTAQVQQLGTLSDGLAAEQRLAYESEIAALRADAWHAAALGPQLDAALGQLAAASEEAQHLGRRLGDLREDKQRLEAELAATARQLQGAPSAADLATLRARTRQLEADLADAKLQTESAQTQLAQVRADLTRTERALAAAQARPVAAPDTAELDALRKQVAQLQAENDRLKQLAGAGAPTVRPPGKPVASAR